FLSPILCHFILSAFPYTTLFRSIRRADLLRPMVSGSGASNCLTGRRCSFLSHGDRSSSGRSVVLFRLAVGMDHDSTGTRHCEFRSEEHTSNSSHLGISYAVFCLK